MKSYTTRHIVEVLTPVHVGSGKELLYDYDYLIKGTGKDASAVVVDQASLFEELALDSSKDISRLLSGTPTLTDLVKVAGSEGTYRYPLKLFAERGEIPKDKIRAHLKDAFFRPYIAGSSIKGAIRTALLADMIEQLGVQSPEIQKRLPTEKIERGESKPSKPDKKAADDLITFLFSSQSQKSQNYDFLRMLQVSDVSFDTSHLAIAEVRWFNLVNEGEPPQTKFKWKDMGSRRSVDNWQKATGVYAETLRPTCQSTEYPLHLKFDTFLLADNTAKKILQWEDKLPCFPAVSDFQELTLLLNRHARKRLEKEKAFFQKYGYSPAQRACEGLLKQMDEKPEAGYLQLGWASGWRGMTGDWMDEPTEKLMRKLYHLGKTDFDFPKTRRLVVKEGQPSLPFGWIRIWSAESSLRQIEEQARDKQRQLALEQARQAQLKKDAEEAEQRAEVDAKKALEEAQRRAQMSPVERQMLELEESKPSQESYITWLQALKNGHWTTPEDQHVVARAIQQQMRIAKVWKETTSAKKPDKDKDFQRTQEVLRYL
jgi:CRISPR/Cas system CSM-associated protein Csm5 (group 7 of RAMP superfamily)